MAKRLAVKYLGGSHYMDMASIPEGTEFKGVEHIGIIGVVIGVMIRGSSLRKATDSKDLFPYKEYFFNFRDMRVI